MMKKINLVLLTIALTFTVFTSKAQSGADNGSPYKHSLGLVGGYYKGGITYKHFLKGNRAVEGLLSSHYNGILITGLYEIHHQAFDEPGLFWYYGGGAHLGSYGSNSVLSDVSTGSTLILGADLVGGLEYNFQEFPINVSLFWKPAINLVPSAGFFANDLNLAVRYRF